MKAMRKCLLVLVCLCLVAGVALSARAAGHVSGSISGSTVGVGETVTVTLSLTETTVSSLGVQINCDGMEVISGQWLQSGLMASFDLSKNKGVFSPGGATTMSGNIFRVTLKAAEPGNHSVSVKVIGKNGTETVFEETVTKTVKVPCQTHSYGDYERNADSHWKTCSACGHKESSAHSWDAGTVTATRTCTQIGKITYTCTICGQTRIEEQPVLAHTESGWIVDQEAQIGTEGSRHTECTVCHAVLQTEAIPALTSPATEPEVAEPEPTESEDLPTESEDVPTEPEKPTTEPELPATQPQTKPTEPPAAPETDPEVTEPATEEQPAAVPEMPGAAEQPATEAPTAEPETKPVENTPDIPETTPADAVLVQTDTDPVMPAALIAAVIVTGIVILLVLRKKKN